MILCWMAKSKKWKKIKIVKALKKIFTNNLVIGAKEKVFIKLKFYFEKKRK